MGGRSVVLEPIASTVAPMLLSCPTAGARSVVSMGAMIPVWAPAASSLRPLAPAGGARGVPAFAARCRSTTLSCA